MSTPATAVEVKLSEAVPNLTASEPSLTSNPNPLNTPPATGLITVAQSPSGSVTNQSAPFNYTNTITSTEEMLTNTLKVESAQQGSLALPNVSAQQVVAGTGITSSTSTPLPINNFFSGVTGTVGNKFS